MKCHKHLAVMAGTDDEVRGAGFHPAFMEALKRTGNVSGQDMIVKQIEVEARGTLFERMPFFMKGNMTLSNKVKLIMQSQLGYDSEEWDTIWYNYGEKTVRATINSKRSSVTQRMKNAAIPSKSNVVGLLVGVTP